MLSAKHDAAQGRVLNFVDHKWVASSAGEHLDVVNPTTAEVLGRVPLGTAAEVAQAAEAAGRAFPGWRRTPAVERVQYLFRLKQLMETSFEDLSRSITLECGKTLDESRAEMRRAIENVEIACGIPQLMQGYNSEVGSAL